MIAHPSSVKVIKYACVSVISTIVSQVTLLLTFGIFHVMSEVPANIVANVLATIPSYWLNRRWVWGKGGKSHFWRRSRRSGSCPSSGWRSRAWPSGWPATSPGHTT